MEKGICPVCGGEFALTQYRVRIYCSERCKRKASLRRAIDSGKKSINTKIYRERHRKKIARHDRDYRYRKYFGGLYDQVVERDKDICQMCGNDNQIVIHHIDRNPTNNVLENLQTLCRACHCYVHHKILEKRTCKTDGCDKKFYALGLCKNHYRRHWKALGKIM